MSDPISPPAAPVMLGYAAPGAYDLFAPSKRASATIILCVVHMVLLLALIAVLVMQHQLLDDFLHGIKASPSAANANDLRVNLVQGLESIVGMSMFIVMLCWLYRAYRNMITMRMYPRFTAGWAVGYWFIPILNLFRSFQILTEMLVLNGRKFAEKGTLGGIWWCSWFFGFLIPIFYTVSGGSSDQIEMLIRRTDSAVLGAILTIISNAILIFYIRRVMELQATEIANYGNPSEPMPLVAAVMPPRPQ